MLNLEVLDCIHEDHYGFFPHHAPTVQSDSQIDIRSDFPHPGSVSLQSDPCEGKQKTHFAQQLDSLSILEGWETMRNNGFEMIEPIKYIVKKTEHPKNCG